MGAREGNDEFLRGVDASPMFSFLKERGRGTHAIYPMKPKRFAI
jgi:hypothetical protein